MKTLRIFSLATLFMALAAVAVAQTKTETFKVSGNCGMCKSKIEKAAKDAGAKSATWNADTKDLTISYKSSTTNTAKIQEMIASVGYDNVGATAPTDAYDKLHACCKYDRVANTNEAKAECCKDGKCTKEGHNGMDCCKKDGEKMDCCKDGKCTKEGHDGKDCCKKDGEKMACCKKAEQ